MKAGVFSFQKLVQTLKLVKRNETIDLTEAALDTTYSRIYCTILAHIFAYSMLPVKLGAMTKIIYVCLVDRCNYLRNQNASSLTAIQL